MTFDATIIIHSYVLHGVEARPVTVTASSSTHAGPIRVTGLPEAAIRETLARVRSALLGFEASVPQAVVTIDPPQRYAQSGLDLPVALALYELARGVESARPQAALGELDLNGGVRPVRGCFAAAEAAAADGLVLAVPHMNAERIWYGDSLPDHVRPVQALIEACGDEQPDPFVNPPPPEDWVTTATRKLSLDDVQGLDAAKQALRDACANGGRLLFLGPPGAGKTLLARCALNFLPPLEGDDLAVVRRIADAAGLVWPPCAHHPFRAPHHTISPVGLVGGGRPPRPGEVTLAHNGVLFLDELPEFHGVAVEAVAQALRAGSVTHGGPDNSVTMPAQPRVVLAAANLCPCGYFGAVRRTCVCSTAARDRYMQRLLARAAALDLKVVEIQPRGEIA